MADDVRNTPNDPESRKYTRHRREAAHPREERVAVYSDDEDGSSSRDSAEMPATIKRIAWGAVFAGALIAIVTQVTLNLLGLSIGLGSIDPLVESNPFSGLGIGAGIWVAVCTIIAFFLGGLVASRLAGMPDRKDGVLHGILSWALVSLVTVYLLWSAVGSIFNTATNVVGEGLQAAGQGIAAVAPEAAQAVDENVQLEGVSLDALVTDLVDQLQQSVTGPPGAEAGDEEALSTALNAFFTPGNDISDRQALIDLLVARTGMTEAEAQQTVEQYDEQFQQLQQEVQGLGQQIQQTAVQIGDTVAAALSSAAFWAFIASIVGAIAAAIGGAVGVPRDLPARASIRRE